MKTVVSPGLSHGGVIARDDVDPLVIVEIGRRQSGRVVRVGVRYREAVVPQDRQSEELDLPDELLTHKDKIFALTIEPERLAAIRELRRPNSDYASMRRCYKEVQMALDMFHRHGMTVLDSTTHSIEELASLIKKSL